VQMQWKMQVTVIGAQTTKGKGMTYLIMRKTQRITTNLGK